MHLFDAIVHTSCKSGREAEPARTAWARCCQVSSRVADEHAATIQPMGSRRPKRRGACARAWAPEMDAHFGGDPRDVQHKHGLTILRFSRALLVVHRTELTQWGRQRTSTRCAKLRVCTCSRELPPDGDSGSTPLCVTRMFHECRPRSGSSCALRCAQCKKPQCGVPECYLVRCLTNEGFYLRPCGKRRGGGRCSSSPRRWRARSQRAS